MKRLPNFGLQNSGKKDSLLNDFCSFVKRMEFEFLDLGIGSGGIDLELSNFYLGIGSLNFAYLIFPLLIKVRHTARLFYHAFILNFFPAGL